MTMGGPRWNTNEDTTVRDGQRRRRPVRATAHQIQRTYGATKTYASINRIWQMPRWTTDDKSYLLFLLRHNTSFAEIKYSFPYRSTQAIRNQILRVKEQL